MSETLKKSGGAILTLVGVLVWGGMTLRENRAMNTYNEFSSACSQPLAQQDALLDEITDDLDTKKVEALVERSRSIESRLEAAPAPNEEILAIKKVLVERAARISEGLEAMGRYLGTEDKEKEKKLEAEFSAKFQEAGKKLDEFVALRDAYLKKYDLKLE